MTTNIPPGGPAVRMATSTQVLDYLRGRGRDITAATWRSYVARRQAPAPVQHVGRTPLWDLDDIDRWLNRSTTNAEEATI